MNSWFNKKPSSSLDKRVQRIQEEMDRVEHDLRLLSKFVEKPNRPVDLSRLKSVGVEPNREDLVPAAPKRGLVAPVAVPRPVAAPPSPSAARPAVVEPRADARAYVGKSNPYDERFADYLASSFQAARPLRQERAIQRNKAIMMMVVVAVLAILVLYRLLKL